MNANQFIETLRDHADQPLLFQVASGTIVQGGFHVTEIKNASYETIDCGNSLHTWKEVIVQLWVPEEATEEDERMTAGKFAKIWDVVDGRIPLAASGELRVEYGDDQLMTSVYHVDRVAQSEDGLLIGLTPPITLCKPRAILDTIQGESACCTPAAVTVDPELERRRANETSIPLTLAVAGVEEKSSCC